MTRRWDAWWALAVIALAASAGAAPAEEGPWRCLVAASPPYGADEYSSVVYLGDVRTGKGEELASFPDFYVWSAAADEGWKTIVVAGVDMNADDRFVFYRLPGPAASAPAGEAEVILEAKGLRQPEAEVIFDASEGAFYLAAEAVGTRPEGKRFRETVLYRYEPAAGPPVELARLGRHVFLDGEAGAARIYVAYDDTTTYGRRRLYGYIDKETYNVTPLGIYPDFFGGEPRRYVPYAGPGGAGQYLPAATATLAGPRAYTAETEPSVEKEEYTIYVRTPGAPGGYGEVKVKEFPGLILYSRRRDALVVLTPAGAGDAVARLAVIYADDGSVGEPVPLAPGEPAEGSSGGGLEYALLYVE